MLISLAIIAALPAAAQEPPASLRVELSADGWQVLDGERVLNAYEFAQATDDAEMLVHLDAELTAARTRTQALLGVGGGLMALSVVPLLLQPEGSEPLASAYTLDQANYSSEEEYLLAQTIADAAYTDAQIRHEIDLSAQREDRTWTAIALAGVGAMTLIAAPYARIGAQHRQTNIANYYEMEAAQARIGPDDPETPAGNDGDAWLELRPVVTPGWVGLQGRF